MNLLSPFATVGHRLAVWPGPLSQGAIVGQGGAGLTKGSTLPPLKSMKDRLPRPPCGTARAIVRAQFAQSLNTVIQDTADNAGVEEIGRAHV